MAVPGALGDLLGRVPAVQRGWQRLAVAERERYAAWVQAGKTSEDRAGRAETAGRLIARGEQLPGPLRRWRLRPRTSGPVYDLTDDPGGYAAGGHLDI